MTSERRGKHRYSKVSRRIRSDAKVKRLSKPPPNGFDMFMWLLTCQQQCVIPGLISIGEAGIAEDLEWPLEGFRKAFAEVSREGLAIADFGARLVWVPNRIKHDEPASPNVIRSWQNDWDELPECALKLKAYEALLAYAKAKGKPWEKAFLEACPKPSCNQDQDQDQDPSPIGDGDAKASPKPSPSDSTSSCDLSADPRQRAMADELQRHTVALPTSITHPKAAMECAFGLMAVVDMNAQPEWLVTNIRRAVAELSPGCTDDAARRKLRRWVERTKCDPALEVRGPDRGRRWERDQPPGGDPPPRRYPLFKRDGVSDEDARKYAKDGEEALRAVGFLPTRPKAAP